MDYPGSNYGNTSDNNQQVNSKYSHFYVFCSFIDQFFSYNHSALKKEKNSSMININQSLVENDVNTPLPVNSLMNLQYIDGNILFLANVGQQLN